MEDLAVAKAEVSYTTAALALRVMRENKKSRKDNCVIAKATEELR